MNASGSVSQPEEQPNHSPTSKARRYQIIVRKEQAKRDNIESRLAESLDLALQANPATLAPQVIHIQQKEEH